MMRAATFVLIVSSVTACDWTKSSAGCSQGPGLSRRPFTGSELPRDTLALTFDGGPGDDTVELADYLFAEDVEATFFVRGAEAAEHAPTLALLKARHHLVANGAFKNRDLKSAADPVQEIRRTDELITPYVSGNIFLLRFPRDSYDDDLIDFLNDAGLRKYVGPISYDVGEAIFQLPAEGETLPTEGMEEDDFYPDDQCWARKVSVEDCAEAYLKQIRETEKGIVLLHDTSRDTFGLVKILVPTLKEEGFSFIRADAVPSVELALEATGAKPGTLGGPTGCDDYK